MFSKLKDIYKQNSARSRLIEEKMYEFVSEEIKNGQKREGLWAKAMSISEGSLEKAKSEYIKLRVQSLKDELELDLEREKMFQTIEDELEEEIATKKAEEELSKYSQREEKVIEILKELGYRAVNYNKVPFMEGWNIYEPLGGVMKIKTLEELEAYAEKRKKEKPDLTRHNSDPSKW